MAIGKRWGDPTISVFDNNIYYGTFTAIPAGGSNNLTSDPLFVDLANDDFRLKPTSPAIDAGKLP